MKISREQKDIEEKLIRLLYGLGLTANYTGFCCILDAVEIALWEPLSLTMVTKWLYPQVAKRHNTNWKAVERNIRTAINIIWNRNSLKLQQLTNFPLIKKPTTAQFLSLLIYYLQFDNF